MPDRRLHLLQLVHCYPPATGGVELSTQTLCERLVADYDFRVTVFTTNTYTIAGFHDASLPRIPIDPAENRNGVRIRRFPVVTRWSPALNQLQRAAWGLRLPGNDRLRTWYHGPISPPMLDAVRRADADVICAASFPLNHLTYPFRRRPSLPVVLVAAMHTNNAWGYDRPHLIRLTQKAFTTVAHTEHERQALIERGAPANRVCVIGHGIDPVASIHPAGAFRTAVGIPADAFLAAYVGQQAGHKGLDVLVSAFPELLKAEANAWLVIAGSRTPYSAQLRALIDRLPTQVSGRILILDDVTDDMKAEILIDADVFVSPSSQEAFGITTLEAWSQATPVIVGDAPSQRSIVTPDENGLIVSYGDSDQLVRALRRLAHDAPLRVRLGEAGRRTVLERYRLPDVIARYADLFAAAARATNTV